MRVDGRGLHGCACLPRNGVLNLIFQLFLQFTEVCFASFLSAGFITAIVVNPPEKILAKRKFVLIKC
jgi:hypothetical protein